MSATWQHDVHMHTYPLSLYMFVTWIEAYYTYDHYLQLQSTNNTAYVHVSLRLNYFFSSFTSQATSVEQQHYIYWNTFTVHNVAHIVRSFIRSVCRLVGWVLDTNEVIILRVRFALIAPSYIFLMQMRCACKQVHTHDRINKQTHRVNEWENK